MQARLERTEAVAVTSAESWCLAPSSNAAARRLANNLPLPGLCAASPPARATQIEPTDCTVPTVAQAAHMPAVCASDQTTADVRAPGWPGVDMTCTAGAERPCELALPPARYCCCITARASASLHNSRISRPRRRHACPVVFLAHVTCTSFPNKST